MRSAEQRLSILGGGIVAASGLLWMVPAINSVAAIAGIVALILILSRLGYARTFFFASVGLILAILLGSLTTGYPEGLYIGLFYALFVVAPAVLIGWASRKLHNPHIAVCYGLIPYGILFMLFTSVYVGLMRNPNMLIENLSNDIEKVVNSNPDLMNLIKQNYGSDDNAVATFLKELGAFLEETLKLLPGFIAALMLGIAVFSLAIAGYIAERMGIIISRFKPFHRWKASGWWLLPTIAGLIPVVFRMNELWFYVGINILIVTGHVYMIVGLAIVEAFFKRALMQTPIKVIFYIILILAGPISMVFLAILGLSDTKFDFKREIEEFENENS
jgi:uncharacterized protein YybS (DUF2232 family)